MSFIARERPRSWGVQPSLGPVLFILPLRDAAPSVAVRIAVGSFISAFIVFVQCAAVSSCFVAFFSFGPLRHSLSLSFSVAVLLSVLCLSASSAAVHVCVSLRRSSPGAPLHPAACGDSLELAFSSPFFRVFLLSLPCTHCPPARPPAITQALVRPSFCLPPPPSPSHSPVARHSFPFDQGGGTLAAVSLSRPPLRTLARAYFLLLSFVFASASSPSSFLRVPCPSCSVPAPLVPASEGYSARRDEPSGRRVRTPGRGPRTTTFLCIHYSAEG